MDNLTGYARVLARVRVKQGQQKRILGRPYLPFGQFLFLGGHFFQLGGILGARHSAKLDAFGPAFLGLQGDPGAVGHFFAEAAKRIVNEYLSESTTLFEYVTADAMGRFQYEGDVVGFFQSFGAKKIKAETAVDFAWGFAESGAALGATHPEKVRDIFDRSHAAVTADGWQKARAAGLDIPATQDHFSYEEVAEDEDQLFMVYCLECCPRFHADLVV